MEIVPVTFDVERSAPTLFKFMASEHPARLAVGPFGSGKSSACMMEFVRRAMRQAPGPDGIRHTRFAAIRNTYRELEDTTRKTFEEWIPGELGHWAEADFTFHLDFVGPDGRVQSEILFRSLDKPGDIKKLLSLELTGAYINEWREIPREIFEGLTGRVGRYPSMRTGGPTWSGIWGDTNPWHPTHWVPILLKKHPDAIKVFRQPSGLAADAENVRNLKPGYYENLCLGKDEEWIRVYVRGEDQTAAVGSIHGALLSALRGKEYVYDLAGAGARDVFTAWDFGIADSTAIWFFRFNARRGVDIIDWHEDSGHGLPHYFDVLDEKGYGYLRHYLPHDARARSLGTGLSAVQLFVKKYGIERVGIAPELSIDDGIGAARWLLEDPATRFDLKCDEVPADKDLSAMGTLAEYKYAWDETNKCFSKVPLHNFASHTADAFRYLACSVKHGELVKPPPAAESTDLNLKPPTWNDLRNHPPAKPERRHV